MGLYVPLFIFGGEKMKLTEKMVLQMAEKIKQNESEIAGFANNLHALLEGDEKTASRPLTVGATPNALAICGADGALPLTITKKVIDKAMRPESRDENGNRTKDSGHFLSERQINQALDNLKQPIIILKGSRENTLVAVTEFKDDKQQQIIVAIELNRNGSIGYVNNITSAYGRSGFDDYIKNNIAKGNVVAINIEKVDKIHLSIGVDFPKANEFINFNNSIAYTTENVKYPKRGFTKTEQKEVTKYPIKVYDINGNVTYWEDDDGYWEKHEYDERGNRTYVETSNGYKFGISREEQKAEIIDDRSTYKGR